MFLFDVRVQNGVLYHEEGENCLSIFYLSLKYIFHIKTSNIINNSKNTKNIKYVFQTKQRKIKSENDNEKYCG